MSAIRKSRGKTDRIHAHCVAELVKKYGYTEVFIRMAIDGKRQSATAELIQKEYRALYKKLSAITLEG